MHRHRGWNYGDVEFRWRGLVPHREFVEMGHRGGEGAEGGRESSIKGQAGGQVEGLMAWMASTFDGGPEEFAIQH